jgi:hypothetical protein
MVERAGGCLSAGLAPATVSIVLSGTRTTDAPRKVAAAPDAARLTRPICGVRPGSLALVCTDLAFKDLEYLGRIAMRRCLALRRDILVHLG